MKIESKDYKIKNLFSRRKYIIPDYQRNYSWSVDEEISIFWEDFLYYLNNDSKSNFFIGPMVYKGEDISASEFEVIDGQQRLITFSILLSVIISLFNKYERADLSEGLKQYLIYKDEKNKEQLVIHTIEPHPFFQKKIFHGENAQPSRPSEKLIEKARVFFEDSIESMLKNHLEKKDKVELLEKIRDSIFNIDTVIIVSDDEVDAFTIFETINTRGKDLSSLELLKNYIFKNYPLQSGINEPKKTWVEITNNIEIERENFFNRFWASWIAKVTENKLYRRFSDYMQKLDKNKNKEFEDIKGLLNALATSSIIYRKITQPLLDDWKKDRNFHIYHHIKNIGGLFKLKVHIPFVLALIEEFEKGKVKQKLLNKTFLLMENFHFVFTHIVSNRASGLDNKYSKFAIRIRNEKDKVNVIEDLKKELLSKGSKEADYIQKFKELNFIKDKDTIKFILLRLEKELDPSLAIDFELNSIEHLEPKSSKIQNVNSIGNLFLLEEKFNNDKKNSKPFDTDKEFKKSIIEKLKDETKYKTTKIEFDKIIESKKWECSQIDKRTEELAKKTFKMFSKL